MSQKFLENLCQEIRCLFPNCTGYICKLELKSCPEEFNDSVDLLARDLIYSKLITPKTEGGQIMAETVDQAVLYTSCAILLNSADCTKYGRGRIHPDRPQLKLSLQSKFWSLMSRSNFLMYALAFIILCSPLGQRILKKSVQTWSRKGRTSTVSISKERKI